MRNSTSERELRSIDGYVAAATGVLLIAGTVLSFVLAPAAGGGWGVALRALLPLAGLFMLVGLYPTRQRS